MDFAIPILICLIAIVIAVALMPSGTSTTTADRLAYRGPHRMIVREGDIQVSISSDEPLSLAYSMIEHIKRSFTAQELRDNYLLTHTISPQELKCQTCQQSLKQIQMERTVCKFVPPAGRVNS